MKFQRFRQTTTERKKIQQKKYLYIHIKKREVRDLLLKVTRTYPIIFESFLNDLQILYETLPYPRFFTQILKGYKLRSSNVVGQKIKRRRFLNTCLVATK